MSAAGLLARAERLIKIGFLARAERIVKLIRRRLFFLWITLSMVICAFLFLPWFLPRETVCGLMGRWQSTDRGWRGRFGEAGARFFNAVLHTGPDQGCNRIWQMEEAARRELYRSGELD